MDASTQRIHLVRGRKVDRWWPVSTAAAGLYGRDGSLGTPPGLHRIHAKIGAGAPLGTVFDSREPTGRIWPGPAAVGPLPQYPAPDLILTRILTLEGLQEGLNRGPGLDSLLRFIYLHGTNMEDRIGRPVSHGCVRLTNRGMVELFDLVDEGDLVAIT